MRVPRFILAIACSTALTLASSLPASAATEVDVARQALPANDGWGAATTGTTGGAAADAAHVFIVTNRAEFVAALNNQDPTPKIIKVLGTIDANVDDAGNPVTCDDYAAGTGYTLDGYLAAYDPAVWGRTRVPSGPMEDARRAAQQKQGQRIQIRIGSNTTIIGVGDDPRIFGFNLFTNNVQNLIIRNLTMVDAFDCFPLWDPTDGATGNWNSQYDNISFRGVVHGWVDHVAFTDGDHADSLQPVYFGRPFQVHDGELDITNASDLITVSYNRFVDHDKVGLVGSSDNAPADVGKLRVTFHHNLYEGLGQRTPRVRFGQNHVYNNYYIVDNPATYVYSWGVGIQSHLFAESNVFEMTGVTPDRIITRFNGTMVHEANNVVNGSVVDIRGAYNAVRDPDLADDTSWTPTLFTHIDSTADVPSLVQRFSGPTLSVGSLALDGLTAFAEAPLANPTGDWTVETWFKDEHPLGFNHEYLTLLNKGDRVANGESPFTISVGFKVLQVASRQNFVDNALRYDLRTAGVDASQWHHVAASFEAARETVTVYLDGKQVAQGVIARSNGNSLPLQIGRNGPRTGKYFQGKLDDVRVWNVARSGADIAAHFNHQFETAPAGLVANWKLDEPRGMLAVDHAGSSDANLGGGATFSTLTHP